MLSELRDTNCSTAETSFNLPRHRWYVIKEGFAASLVETAVIQSGCDESDCIIDPFCGSGTVPVTAALKKHRVVGVEVNPFLSFVSRTKLTQCSPQKVEQGLQSVLKGVKRGALSNLESFSTFSETKNADKWLFNRETLRAFEGGWRTTADLSDPSRRLLRLCLIGAAMDSCNAFPDGKCLRYRSDWQKLKFGLSEFQTFLEHRINQVAEDLRSDPIDRSLGTIIPGDAREVLKRSEVIKFRLCVTSPPYLNSFDYTDVYRPELFLSKTVRSAGGLHRHRFHTVRSHVQVKWSAPKKSEFGPLYDSSLREIQERQDLLWNKRLPLMIQAYFEDIENILTNLRRWAAPNAKLWFVVSTSAYAGVEIPVDLITAHVGERVGWSLKEIEVIRRLRPSGQHTNKLSGATVIVPRLRESIVIFDANGIRK
jgi:DNA modification methylase